MKEEMINSLQHKQPFGYQRYNGDMLKFTPHGELWDISAYVDAAGQIEIDVKRDMTRKQVAKYIEDEI